MQKYDVIGLIGQGAYGVVMKCRCNESKQIVAIKKFKQTQDDEIVKKTTMRQVKVLKMLKNNNIVQLKSAFRKKGIVYLVFQYVQNNLLEVLEKTPDGIQLDYIKIIIYQLLKGLAYLHSLNIVHRDIKPQNLLISDRKQLKICDFGFARVLKRNYDEDLTDYVATRWYRPPQLLVGAKYGKQIDIWAVGCIFGELIDGNPMFPGQNQLDQLFLIQKCLGPLTSDHQEIFLKNPRYLGMKFPQIHKLQSIDKRYIGKLSSKAMNFLKQILKMNPQDRMTAVQALKHSYFDGIREQEFIRKLSSNNNMKHQNKVYFTSKQQCPNTVAYQRKKNYKNNFGIPSIQSNLEYQRTQQQSTGNDNIFQNNNNNKISNVLQASKKSKQEVNKNLTLKGFNTSTTNHSKSVNKNTNKAHKIKQRNISLEKHDHRQIVNKTQNGFYITGKAGGIIHQRHDQDQSSTSGYSRNKIYNVKSPKLKQQHQQQQKRNNIASTEQIHEEGDQQTWQSTAQLPALMVQHQKTITDQQHKHKNISTQSNSINNNGFNINITNSTFNYKNY